MKTKIALRSKIDTYKKRREVLRERYGKSYHYNKEYAEKTATINKRLDRYRALYNDIDFRHRLMLVVHKHLCDYLRMENGTIRNLKPKKINYIEKMGISIFCKFVYENLGFGIRGGLINEFLGLGVNPQDRGSSRNIRQRFTKSFKEYDGNRRIYSDFKRYFKEYHGEEELQKEINKFPDTYIRARNRAKKIARS